MPATEAGAAAGAYTLRRATAADGAAVADLYRRSFLATFGNLYPADDLHEFLSHATAGRFAGQCADAEGAVFLGENAQGELAGYALLGGHDLGRHAPELVAGQRWWALSQLYLDQSAQGSGLADLLMQAAIAESRARRMQVLYLTVLDTNARARRFYARHGFVEVGCYPYRLGRSIDDDRILRLML